MIRRPPESTRTDTPFPSTTLFRSVGRTDAANAIGAVAKAMKLDSLTTKFLGVLAENRRLADLPGMIDEEARSEEHTSELQSLMRISYAVFCLNKKTKRTIKHRILP